MFCTEPNCGRPYWAKGLCRAHYTVMYRARVGFHTVNIMFHKELFEGIATFAKKHRITNAEAVRTLCEWGLEEDSC